MMCTRSWLDCRSDSFNVFKSVLLISLIKHAINVIPDKDSNSSSSLVPAWDMVKLETCRGYLIY